MEPLYSCKKAYVLIDFKLEWPKIYEKVNGKEWFEKIAEYYFTFVFEFSGDRNYRSRPVIRASDMWKEDDEETRQILKGASSPSKPEWWITPHDCYLINGLFLYLIMTYLGFQMTIYQGENHVFLRDEKGRIADLYWQPLNIVNNGEYDCDKQILPLDLWKEIDILRFMIKDPLINFIFDDNLINIKVTKSSD